MLVMIKSIFNRRKINTIKTKVTEQLFRGWSHVFHRSHVWIFFKALLLRWTPSTRAQVERSETNRRAEWTIHYETTWVNRCSAAKLCFVPSVGLRWERGTALAHTRCWTRHPCKHHRNKIIQPAFTDFGRFPIFLVPYLEFLLPCWASQHCVGVICLCDTRKSHWMLCTNSKCKVYFHCSAYQNDVRHTHTVCHTIQEGMVNAQSYTTTTSISPRVCRHNIQCSSFSQYSPF